MVFDSLKTRMRSFSRRDLLRGGSMLAAWSLVVGGGHAAAREVSLRQSGSGSTQATIRRGYALTPRGQIHYYEAGQGKPLLLLHRSPASGREFLGLLQLLAPHFRVIAADLPGFGQSDPLPAPLSMEKIAASMGQLLDALGIDRAHVYGFLTGNKVAAAMAAQSPKRVDRLVICGLIHAIIPDQAKRNEAIRAIVAKYLTEYPESPNGEHHLRRWMANWADLSGMAWPGGLTSKAGVSAQDIEDIRLRLLQHLQALPNMADTYRANFAFDFGAAMERITAPTLVIELPVPEEEERYGRQLQAVCAKIRGSRGVTIEQREGGVPVNRDAEIAKNIIAFLGAG